MASSSKLYVTARRAVLPDSAWPVAATLEIDTVSGKIIAVHQPGFVVGMKDVTYIEVPDDKILLPGLIE